MQSRLAVFLVLLVLSTHAPANAAEQKVPDRPPPAQMTELLHCRTIANDGERLACYDKTAAAVDEAVSKRDIVVFDREGVRKTKRGLFGLGLPNLGIFGDDDDAVEVSQIDSEILGIGHNGDGGLVFILKDETTWTQIDQKPFALPPEAGDKVIVKRGALGSYILRVEGFPGVKVKRIK